MKQHRRIAGFGTVELLLILVIVGILGFTGWFLLGARNNANKSYDATNRVSSEVKANSSIKPQISTQSSKSSFALPSGWKWYENNQHMVKIAYPQDWDTVQGFTANLDVISESDATIQQGCGDPACEVKYDPAAKKWTGSNVLTPITPVQKNSKSEAYLVPIKGEMYCGSYGLYIHFNAEFVHSVLSLCEKNDDPNFQPKDGVLSYEEVAQDLNRVLDSVTVTK